MQAGSKRVLGNVEYDLPLMASVALSDVCRFTAVLLKATAPETIRVHIQEWWRDVGRHQLLPAGGDDSCDPDCKFEDGDQLSDEEGADVEEEGDLDVPEEECLPNTAEEHELKVAASMSAVEDLAFLEKEFSEVSKSPPPDIPMLDAEDVEKESEAETDEEATEIHSRKQIKLHESKSEIRTLRDVLDAADLMTFKAAEKETDRQVLKRVARLSDAMALFGNHMRISEGILSKASVLSRRIHREYNKLENQLALARAAHQCSAQRQSRMALWANFSDRVLEVASEAGGAAAKVARVGPPKVSDDGPEYQLLAIKPGHAGSASNSIRFGIPVGVCSPNSEVGTKGSCLWHLADGPPQAHSCPSPDSSKI